MSTEEDFSLGTFNLAGVTPFAGSGTQIPHRIPVRAKIVEFGVKPREGDIVPDGNGGTTLALNAMVQVEVTEPAEYAGARRSFFARFAPHDDSENGKKDWKRVVTVLVSGGYSEADVAVDGLELKKSTFLGLDPLRVRNEHVMKDGKADYDQITIITPEVFADESDRIAKGQYPDQTPIQITSKKARAEAAGGGSGGGAADASAGKGGAASGGTLTKSPAKGGGGAKSLRSALSKSA
jgi:hypothetical protein